MKQLASLFEIGKAGLLLPQLHDVFSPYPAGKGRYVLQCLAAKINQAIIKGNLPLLTVIPKLRHVLAECDGVKRVGNSAEKVRVYLKAGNMTNSEGFFV